MSAIKSNSETTKEEEQKYKDFGKSLKKMLIEDYQ